ncbi:MAG TPA: hemerythrin domain-containing protein [Acidimicrobiales bacterium]|nr:hemerythrin domain-containing protein [Acidimicrobiales bacterium]
MTTLPTLDPDGRPTPVTLFLAIHHALRRDAHRFPVALRAATDLPRVARHWDQYREILVFHHDQEDALLFPQVLAEAPELAGVVEQLAADHHSLDDLLVRVDAACAALPAGAAACADLVAHLATVLGRHLDLEEEHLVPVMERGTLADGPAPGGGPQNPAFTLPWLADDLAPDVVTALLAAMPADWRSSFPEWQSAYRTGPVPSAV